MVNKLHDYKGNHIKTLGVPFVIISGYSTYTGKLINN